MKNILLTGDSKGLGENIKRKLLDSGYNVIGLSRSSSDIQYDLKYGSLIGAKCIVLHIGFKNKFISSYRQYWRVIWLCER